MTELNDVKCSECKRTIGFTTMETDLFSLKQIICHTCKLKKEVFSE